MNNIIDEMKEKKMRLGELKRCILQQKGFDLDGCKIIVHRSGCYPFYNDGDYLEPIDLNDEDNIMDGVDFNNLSWRELKRAYNELVRIIRTQKRERK